MTSHEGAAALNILRDRDGQVWVSADSLVELFEQMATDTPEDGPLKKTLTAIAKTFRPLSTYAELDQPQPVDADQSTMAARHCPRCATLLIDGQRIGGDPIIIDAEPVPDGELFPLSIRDGVPVLAPWRPQLDGLVAIRVREHTCGHGGQ